MAPAHDGQLSGALFRSFAIRCSACAGLYELGRGFRIRKQFSRIFRCEGFAVLASADTRYRHQRSGELPHPAVLRVSTIEKIRHRPAPFTSWKASTPQCEKRGPAKNQ